MRQLTSLTGILTVLCTYALFTFTSCVKDETYTTTSLAKNETNQIVIDWMNQSLQLTKDAPGYTSPVAARTFAYLGLAMYETILPGTDLSSMKGKFQEFNGTPGLSESGDYNWSLAVNECLYTLNKKFYRNSIPANLKNLDNFYAVYRSKLEKNLTTEVITRSVNRGQQMAESIYAYSITDGQDNAFLNNYPANYTGPNGQGLWNPSSSEMKKPLQPYWGEVRTFIKTNATSSITDVTPPAFSTDKSSVFFSYALEVRNHVKNLNRDEEIMVKYWNDEIQASYTPAGHLLSVLLQILQKENKDLAYSAKAIMTLAVTLHDATVATWKTKFTFNTIRPENYIKSYIDDNFITLIHTPSTPEYSCGQAALAAAASEVLGSMFGYNYSFTDRSYENRKDIDGTSRTYKSFEHMAQEITMSNLLGGIHYRFSLEQGEKQGAQIGKNILEVN